MKKGLKSVKKQKEELIIQQVIAERARQDGLWGKQIHHPFKWVTILGEEFGEVCKAALEAKDCDYRTELVHVAGVAVAAIDSIDKYLGSVEHGR